ncbi:MAG: 16S rRNA (cytidine(1402)-2'-O)-methyltransferase [Spirochaetes bacterium]|nr:16S rRNA (cytidine(1402)-2'-O)-methyltransferase [Spirochaetota bacterium]
MSTLYMVATPIGNLGDITFRAVETLKAVDSIACEDTRHTLRLLNHYEIRKPLVACYGYEEEKGAARVVGILDEGRDVAYCSDAGTPGMSDPGRLLAARVREGGHAVVPIPGPSAFAALVSACGLPFKAVLFEGFPSPKNGRRKSRLAELLDREDAFLLYESPHRILKLLSDIADIDVERQICVGRELTKLHEELVIGTAGFVRDDFSARSKIMGEFSVLVTGRKKA